MLQEAVGVEQAESQVPQHSIFSFITYINKNFFDMAAMFDQKPKPGDSSAAVSTEENHLDTSASVNNGTVSPPIVDPELEKQALKRFDLFLLPQLALLTILAYLDRTNIGEKTSCYVLRLLINDSQEMPKCSALRLVSTSRARSSTT